MRIEEYTTSLCCCEYIDENGDRNHILACCCDCQNLDESFECIVTGEPVPQQKQSAILGTMFDRLRIPWLGGAKQVAPDVAFSVFSQLGLISLASVNFPCTIISGICFGMLFLYIRMNVARFPNFFSTWTITSIVLIYFIFEYITVPFLQILLEENVAMTFLLIGFLFCAYCVRKRAIDSRNVIPNDVSYNCKICRADYNQQIGNHQYWINSCVTSRNMFVYILTLFFAVAFLLYSANITLTTICRPYVFYMHILLPDDCSDAYAIIELSLPFVIALYSTFISLLLLVEMSLYVWMMVVGNTKRKCICFSVFNKMKNTCLCFK